MKAYHVLFVDDDIELREIAKNRYSESEDIDVKTAGSLSEAKQLIKHNYFHSALVDIQLIEGPRKNVDGMAVLRLLADSRPSCSRFLLTQYPDKYRKVFFDLIYPIDPLVKGALDKLNFDENFTDLISKLAERWLERNISVKNRSQVFELLSKKGISSDNTDLTVHEIDYLISMILGQDLGGGWDSDEDVNSISLHPLKGGRSRSVVVLGIPETKSGSKGIRCVIKIGPRIEIYEEHMRYLRFVRLLVSHNKRVELLGFALADLTGAMCYSFAGKSPSHITSMEKLLIKKDTSVINHINTVPLCQ